MQAEVRTRRRTLSGALALALVSSAVAAIVGPLGAQSVSPQTRTAAATDVEPWAACPHDDAVASAAPRADLVPGRIKVEFSQNLLSLDIRGCTLAHAVAMVAARTSVRISLPEPIPQSRLSARIPAQSIDATLRELLREFDVFVLYTAAPNAAQQPTAVWAYPRGTTRDVEPVPADRWASTRELQRQHADWTPDQRARAIEELVARIGESALPDVMAALGDGNADIRQRALDAALVAGLGIPLADLHALTLNDASPEVRLRALQALEERPDSASVIEAATRDPDAAIRREASSILLRVGQSPP